MKEYFMFVLMEYGELFVVIVTGIILILMWLAFNWVTTVMASFCLYL